ncbi:unnamed protein product [Periconia digitata]|uniref:HhH-GPD domain-containing protein n=1 Tax=Periconia digitata TaxID=1303443 RepID=A0A9W4UEP8_9PLEO|nr:unnamed protein product [Periconia digitata]
MRQMTQAHSICYLTTSAELYFFSTVQLLHLGYMPSWNINNKDFPTYSSCEHACASLDRGSIILENAALEIVAAAASLQHSCKDVIAVESKITKKRYPQTLDHGATISPYFVERTTESHHTESRIRVKAIAPPTKSPHFPEPFSRAVPLRGLNFQLQPPISPCNLIQERICNSLYALVIQSVLWNKTHGSVARPILWNFLVTYPTIESLAITPVAKIEHMIRRLGLQKERSARLVEMANVWIAAPPCPERRYQRHDYPNQGDGRDVKKGVAIGLHSQYQGWEIAHLPGVGKYALDSFRIFGRDRLRGLHGIPGVEPEWKRVVPEDKELGPFVEWMWAQEGWDFNVKTGTRVRVKRQFISFDS